MITHPRPSGRSRARLHALRDDGGRPNFSRAMSGPV
jgi:hypothetical protein